MIGRFAPATTPPVLNGKEQKLIDSPFGVAIFEPRRAQSPQRFKKVFLRALSVLCGKFGVQFIQPHYKG
jgi:hypothetical protein